MDRQGPSCLISRQSAAQVRVGDGSALGTGADQAPEGLSPLARISAPMFARRKNQLWGSCLFGGDGGGKSCRIAPSRPGSEATAGASPETGSSRSCGLPAAATAVSPGMGLAPRPHILAAGPRRTQDRQAPLRHCHGLEVRPANPRGSHLLGLGPGHRLDPEYSGPSGAAGPDRAGVVHTGAALPVRGGELGCGGRVPASASVEVAPRYMDYGLGGSPFGCCRAGVRQRPAVCLVAPGGSLPGRRRPCRWCMRIAQ